MNAEKPLPSQFESLKLNRRWAATIDGQLDAREPVKSNLMTPSYPQLLQLVVAHFG